MPVELKVPSVGESITEVQIGDWLKAVGDTVNEDDIIVMLETDKVTVELPAPVSGTIAQILLKKGETAHVGDVVGYLEAGAVAAKPGSAPTPTSADAPSPSADPGFELSAGSDGPSATIPPPASAPRVMPAAQRALHAAGLDASQVLPSGPGGRTLKEDVQRHVENLPLQPAEKRSPASGPARTAGARPEVRPPPTPGATVCTCATRGRRKRVKKRSSP